MIKRVLGLIAVLGAVGIALALVSAGRAGPSDVIGSDHDVASAGEPACEQCHIPHKAQGSYLWARTPGDISGNPTLGGSAALCLSCHDGSITDRGGYIFDVSTANHRMNNQGHGSIGGYGDGYCLACHDAHDPDFNFTKDMMKSGRPENPDNANVCLSCHSITHPTRGLGASHPFDVEDPADLSWRTFVWTGAGTPTPTPVATRVAQMTPVPGMDQTFDPDTADTEGTRLWDSSTRKMPVDAGQSGKLGCLTCHTAHGATGSPDPVTRPGGTPVPTPTPGGPTPTPEPEANTLNTEAPHTEVDTTSPICQNCHQ